MGKKKRDEWQDAIEDVLAVAAAQTPEAREERLQQEIFEATQRYQYQLEQLNKEYQKALLDIRMKYIRHE